MHPIELIGLMSNHGPDRYGSHQKKGVNPCHGIHPRKLRLQTNIQTIFRINIYRIVYSISNLGSLNFLQIHNADAAI
jgi:hypothetical protein